MKNDRALSFIAVTGFAIALVSALAAVISGFGTRWEWWHFREGFTVLRWAAYGGLASLGLSLAGCILTRPRGSRRGLILSVTGLIISLVVAGIPSYWFMTVKRVPPIHDITTDTENPPLFVSVLALRKDAPNPAEYGGPEIAAKQRAAYPDLQPLILSVSPKRAFDLALAAARKTGWEIVGSDEKEGRIEATDTTFWFGFKDDIVIRIAPGDGGSRVDIRSVSRVGRSDVGTNAKRIRTYHRELKALQKGL